MPHQVGVLGVAGVYPKLRGQELLRLLAVDLGNGKPVALGAVSEKEWRAGARTATWR